MGAPSIVILYSDRLDRDDEDRSEERMAHVERELTGLQRRLNSLLAYIRQDDMAPLTPMVRPTWSPPNEEQRP